MAPQWPVPPPTSLASPHCALALPPSSPNCLSPHTAPPPHLPILRPDLASPHCSPRHTPLSQASPPHTASGPSLPFPPQPLSPPRRPHLPILHLGLTSTCSTPPASPPVDSLRQASPPHTAPRPYLTPLNSSPPHIVSWPCSAPPAHCGPRCSGCCSHPPPRQQLPDCRGHTTQGCGGPTTADG